MSVNAPLLPQPPSTLAARSQPPTSKPHHPLVRDRRRGNPFLVYGYLAKREWLAEYCDKHCEEIPLDASITRKVSAAAGHIDVRLPRLPNSVICPETKDLLLCWSTGSNRTKEDIALALNPKRVSELKAVMEREDEPSWYRIYS